MIELLVVIGILALLTSILIPAVTYATKAARLANTRQMISRLSAAIENYYHDFNAYPGPISTNTVCQVPPMDPLPTGISGGTFTMSENLTLGLLGGLYLSGDQAAFDINRVYTAAGAGSLNAYNPKNYAPYIEAKLDELTKRSDNGMYKDLAGRSAGDSNVPEFLDKFSSDAMPILYLRARNGAPGIMSDKGADKDTAGGGGGSGQNFQYDRQQIAPYVVSSINLKTTAGYSNHGLNKPGSANPLSSDGVLQDKDPNNSSLNFPNPYLPYFRQTAGTSGSPNANGTPKQKDGFVLISAGEDRIYGTLDDIVNFGNLK